MQKEITIRYAGNEITLFPDDAGLFCLNLLHELTGESKDGASKPSNWARIPGTKALIAEYDNAHIRAFKSKRGRNGGSWACEELVYSYASWISADFHKVVLDAFTAAANGDGEKAVKVARTAVRVDGIHYRKVFAQQLARCGATKGDYGSQTDVIYLTLHGKPAKELKEERGVKKSGSLRDAMSDIELQQITAAEAVAALKMMKSDDKSRGDMRKAVFEAAQFVKTC